MRKKEDQKMSNENTEFFEALRLLEKEKGIPMEFMFEKISSAIVVAVKRSYNGNDDVVVNMDPHKNQFEVFLRKEVVDDVLPEGAVMDPDRQIFLSDARKLDPTVSVGDEVSIKLETKQFGRIGAQAAKHVIRQGIREVERGQVMQEFQNRNQELVSAVVERIDPRTGAASLTIGKAEAVLPKTEQVGAESLKEGDHIKVYVVDVKDTEKGPRAMISRTHPGLVKRLFETEVPEIYDGTVEIKAVSREAGSRTKLAVFSKDPNVDAVGACIGPRGARVGKIVDELGGEKIDIVEYSEDPAKFISAALSPATVVSVTLEPDGSRACHVSVPDSQLSLAIGNRGQNARLAAKLTGWKIDIRPESGFFGEEPQA